jgi:hypothetical protein
LENCIMATIPAVGGISSASLASAGETAVLEDGAVRSIDLRYTPVGSDGATWAVFAFLFLIVVVGLVCGAAFFVAHLRRTREVDSAPNKLTARAHSECNEESLSHAA